MWRIIMVFVIVFGLTAWFLWTKPNGYYATAISDTGALVLSNGSSITLAGVEIPPRGEEKHEAAVFFLKEITRDTEIWYEKERGGYRVWVGCKRYLGRMDCSKGFSVNEAMLKTGVGQRDD